MSRTKIIALFAVVFILVTASSVYFFWHAHQVEPVIGAEESLPADGKLHVLLIGEDDGLAEPGKQGIGRSDTLMVASYDPQSGALSLLSIPRDALVEIPGRKYKDKINHAFAFGGVDLTMRTVRQFLNMPIRYYVHVRTDGFRRIVDAIGGVPINVEKNMKYRDRAGDLYIDLQKGEQVLNGQQAEGYVRWRLDSDLMRVARQQKFIAAALREVIKPANIFKLNQLTKIAMESVKTNIPINVGLRYLSLLDSLKTSNISSFTVAGDDEVWINGINYFAPDLDKLQVLIADHFYTPTDKSANAKIKVKVLVGNDDQPSGEQVLQLLKQHGFQVEGLGTADRNDYLISQVTSADKDAALAVARALQLHEVLIASSPDAVSDVVVVVGCDLIP